MAKKNVKLKKKKDRAVSNAAQEKSKRKKGRVIKIILSIIKWLIILGSIVGLIIFFLTSPIFNVKQIEVNGNEKVSTEEIINLSGIEKDVNIYKYSKKAIKDALKQNPYIEEANIYRILPDKIEISIKERKTSFLLQLEGSYAYINNQGYILELNKENIYLPIITGFSTSIEDIKEGSKLCEEDLKKLQVVLNIMDIANSNQISELITGIDISDVNNYTINLETESKIAYLGTSDSLNMKILYLKGILQREKGVQGEVFLKDEYMKLDRVFFREKE